MKIKIPHKDGLIWTGICVVLVVVFTVLFFDFKHKTNIKEEFPGTIIRKESVFNGSYGKEKLYFIVHCDKGFNYTINVELQTYALHNIGDRVNFILNPAYYDPSKDISHYELISFLSIIFLLLGLGSIGGIIISLIYTFDKD